MQFIYMQCFVLKVTASVSYEALVLKELGVSCASSHMSSDVMCLVCNAFQLLLNREEEPDKVKCSDSKSARSVYSPLVMALVVGGVKSAVLAVGAVRRTKLAVFRVLRLWLWLQLDDELNDSALLV